MDVLIDKLSTIPPVSLAIAVVLLLVTIIYFAVKNKDIPPGPIGLPYLGYWPFLNNATGHLKLDALKQKYGDIFSFSYTGRLYINLGSIKANREALISKSECFGDRQSGYNFMGHIFRDGVAFQNGEPWKVIRKFFMQVLRERGSNSLKSSLSASIYDSISSTINELKAKKGEPVNFIEILTNKCNAFLRFALFGDYGITEEQVRRFNELYSIQVEGMSPTNLLLIGTIARYFIYPFTPKYFQALKTHNEMRKMLYGIVNKHKATYDKGHIRNFIDEYIEERDKRRSKGDPTAEYFTDEVLVGTLMQFMGDGVLAVASFATLLLKNLLENPEEQEKVYKEIVEVIGTDRPPAIEDKSQLTYFNAYLLESLRMGEFFNYLPSQECTKEVTVGGYKIPKGAIMIINFYCAHNDPKVYEEPKKFNPSRFIQTEGKKRAEMPISFGMGKRACLGEGYAMTQIFLQITTMLQNFQLSLPERNNKIIDYEEFVSGKLLICAKPRDHK
ncbi:cytochrome P450 18a1 [Caerostris extrusa]|uniref:Cytochrome P450 18a1 n=1 Tax=Caerostris extrusa TaxID=172846 RepID=A0AAV4NG61_CAEEX|nr:cytochrome P450 18a1 [Caerostris extrusa]